MGLFKKKGKQTITELKCPAEACSFTCYDLVGMKRNVEWKHPEMTTNVPKSK